ncbi:glycosyltransferase family 4 protein [Candidatus Binatia bacterium]|nr:glycosyltransferase family 4 protein [Candidatus Binatia bacterium]
MPDSPLRICLVSTFYPPYNFGGDGIYAHRLANGLARRGHSVTVLHSPSAYEMLAGRRVTDRYRDHPSVTVRPVWTPLGALGLLAVQQSGRPAFQARALRRLLDSADYDVVHYNNVSLLGGPHVFNYGRGLKLCTLIEHWLVCPMHVLWKFDREVCVTPECFRCQLAGRRPPQAWRYTGLMDRATRQIDAFVGPSVFTIRMHQARGLRGAMIQLPLFHPEPGDADDTPPAPNGGRPYFLFTGRLEKIKGVQALIPVLREMPAVDLVVAGNGGYEPALRRLAAGASNIVFLGRVDHARLQTLYRNALATLVPSLCYETFGLIVAESYSAGTPVVVFAQSSLEELVRAHGGGLLYRTADELRDALDQLRSDPALRQRLGREGRIAYEAEFAEDAFLDHYVGVVRALLANRRAGRPAVAPDGRGDDQRIAGRRVYFA